MKKLLLLSLLAFGYITAVWSQATIVFHENFELPGQDDSVTYFSSPAPGDIWNINTRLHYGTASLRSDSCQVKTGQAIYMTSVPFNTTGNTNVILYFDHICKVDFLDIATIEVSNNGGQSWVQLTGAQYQGTGQYAANGNRFAANSYGNLWQPSNAGALPTNTWWRSESFDIGLLIGNANDARIRFRLSDGGQPGPNGNKGWYLDNIRVLMAPSELTPPTIVLVPPVITGIVWSVGPFQIKAKISDASGIDTAKVIYSINNGPYDTVGMVDLPLDTMMGIIPTVNDSDVVCWWVEAFDASPAYNWAREPVSTCNQFTAYAGITFPFFDNFDVNLGLWTPSYGGSNQQSTWQLGQPSYGVTSSTHSPPKAWDVNLTTAYASNAYCILTSPVFDFSNAVDARLAFWMNYYCEGGWDGTRLEYTTNGTNWQLLGSINSPLATNWYNSNINSSNQPAWNGQSNGWKKAKIKLSNLNNVVGQVRFRYIFTSDGSGNNDGFSIDDFSITLPAPQEATCEGIIATSGGCGLGNETVKIKIHNAGLTPITGGLTAGFRKSPTSPPVTETVPNTIQPGDTLLYTFTTPVNLQAIGADSIFTLKAWVNLINDPNLGDDTASKVIQSKFVPNSPGVTSVLIPYGTFTTITATSPHSITWFDQFTGGTQIGTGPNYTTPILYGTMVYFPMATASNGCVSVRARDTVYVGSPPPFDGATLSILTPNTGFNLTTSETVTARIRNYGTDPIFNFPIRYSINNGPPVTETVTDTLEIDDIIDYVFTTPANLSAYQVYQFKSWVDVPGDQNHINDTATKTVENKMFVYCESRATSTGYEDIGNVTISNLNNGNPLPTFNNGASAQLYTDFTNLPPIFLTRGQTYNISVSVIFASGHYGTCCKVFVDWNYDGVFDEIIENAFTAGPTTQTNTTLTGTITVPVNAHLGITRFRVIVVETGSPGNIDPCGLYTWGETEDYLALVMPQLDWDAGVTAINIPPVTYPQGYTNPPTMTIKNFGLNAIDSVDVSYVLDNNPPVTQTWIGNLAPNGSTQVTFPTLSWPLGYHSFCAYTTLPGDSNTFNDTICRTIQGVPVDTLAYYDNFDGVIKFFPTSNTGTSWIHGAPVPPNWPSPAYSPPNVWATNLNMTGYTASALCYLTTQIFDFTNAINAKIMFQYNADMPTTGDGVQLQYSQDGGNTWQPLGSQNDPLGINWHPSNITSLGAAWAGNSGGWKKATYLLSNFNQVPTMRFRFVFLSNTATQQKGFAIDNFAITIPYPIDAGVDSILLPNGQAVAGTQLYPQVRLVNYSSTNLTSVDIKYRANQGPLLTHTWTGSLVPGASAIVNLSLPYIAPQGNYTLSCYTDLTGDGDHMNDTTKKILFGIPTFTIPYNDNFDSTLTYWYTTGTQWQHGTPTSSVINAPQSPPFCWKTILNGIYQRTGQDEFLYSPMFDFSQTGYDSLVFDHWSHIYENDIAYLEYLSTNGWQTLGWLGDPNAINWYTNANHGWTGFGVQPGWHQSAYDLKVITNFATPTQFRYYFKPVYVNTSFDGWAVDNFRLTSPKIPKDAGVISIIQPSGQTIYGTDLNVSVRIKNFGSDTLTDIPVKYQLDGITSNFGTWTGSLLPDSTTVYNFPPIPSPLSDYALCAYTDLPGDDKYFNDTICTYITVQAPDYDLLVNRIIAPEFLTIHGESATVTINIKNVGQFPVTEIPVGYDVGTGAITVHETLLPAQALNPGDSIDYTFNTPYNYEFLGWYYLCAFTEYLGDGYMVNDTNCRLLEEKYTWIAENDPDAFYLSQNIPNPTDGSTQIMIRLPRPGEIQFELVNMVGQTIYQRKEKLGDGMQVLTIETGNIPSGIYSYNVIFNQKRIARKMVISH